MVNILQEHHGKKKGHPIDPTDDVDDENGDNSNSDHHWK